MRFSSVVALAASLSTSAAVYQGFNYGSTKADGSFNYQADFQSLFSNAQNLVGTSGFASARLYTMIQGGSSTNEPTEAIPAAISTGTTLLLGLWASGGQGPFSAELDALASAISQYGDDFAKLVVGISVGSEDLYRASPTGQAANAGVGASSATVTSYITQLRAAIKGTSLGNVPVGHVDTWTGWTEGGISDVIDASDFIGMDAYPYFQNTMANSIDDGKSLFNAALAATQAAVGSKPVWITETGWPVSGSTQNLAVPSLANAKTYWDEVGCPLFGNTNTWWFTLQDSNGATPNPSFGIIGGSYGTTPLYDLSCSGVSSSSTSSQSSTASTSASATGGSGSGSSSAASATSSLSSEASSLSTAASGGQVVSSGSGLTPSEGAGNGIGSVGSASATVTSSTSTASGISGSNSTIIGTGAASGIKTSTKTGTASSTSTGPSTISSNAASALSGSFAGALGAFFVAIAAL